MLRLLKESELFLFKIKISFFMFINLVFFILIDNFEVEFLLK